MKQINQKPDNLTLPIFRWTIVVIDFVIGIALICFSFALFFRRGVDFTSTVPDEFWAILLTGYGIWILYTGYRLVIERSPVCWQRGKRRHLFLSGFSGGVVPLLWLSLFDNPHQGQFGPVIRVMNYSAVFCTLGLFLLIVALVMPVLASQEPSDKSNLHSDRMVEKLKPPGK